MMYAFLRWIMRTLTRGYLVGLFRVEGREHFPISGGVLVCPNHASTIDPPMVPAFLPRGDSWSMAKAEYFEKRNFTNWLFTRYHAFPVVRHSADRRALKRASDLLREGHVLVVYPEGTRVETGGLEHGEPGAGFLGQKLQPAVVPVALVGTRECFPKGARWPRRVPVRMITGRPFHLAVTRADGSKVPPQEATDAIMLSIAEMLPEDRRGKYADLELLRQRVGSLRLYEADETSR
jgi:1-acyl-sn-glycerol-3-phosphate acyltransferase